MVSIRPAERGIQYTQPVETFDRKGDPIFVEDMDGSLATLDFVCAGTGKIEQSGEYALQGSRCLKFITATAIGNYATMRRYQTYQNLSKHGTEISFTYTSGFTNYEFSIELYEVDWYTKWGFRIVYIAGADVGLSIYDVDGNWTPVATDVSLKEADYIFNTIKFVVDFRTKKYVRAMVAYRDFDVAIHGGESYSSPGETPYMLINNIVRNRLAASSECWMDRFVITQKEP